MRRKDGSDLVQSPEINSCRFVKIGYTVPQGLSVKLFSKTSLSGATSAKICAWKYCTSVSSSCQASGGSPALTQVWERNSSESKPHSGATWGRSRPENGPLETISPSLPITTSSGSFSL